MLVSFKLEWLFPFETFSTGNGFALKFVFKLLPFKPTAAPPPPPPPPPPPVPGPYMVAVDERGVLHGTKREHAAVVSPLNKYLIKIRRNASLNSVLKMLKERNVPL